MAKGFSDQEKEAMKERASELVLNKGDGEEMVLSKIALMNESDRGMALKIHKLIKDNAPMLVPKTWYGMPAYANIEGKVVCFFQAASKFKTRYATFGFSDMAKLDTGSMWPVTFALIKLSKQDEAKIMALVNKAI